MEQMNGEAGKVSGKRDIFDSFFSHVNKTLFIFKLFYFFFFAAFGSLFPLISVYFKQLGMSGFQSGVLVGIRPFIEFFSGPFWNGIADKWRKGKLILFMSLICWIVFTLSINFVQPAPTGCLVAAGNGTKMHRIAAPYLPIEEKNLVDQAHLIYNYHVGQSPIQLDSKNLINKGEHSQQLVVPMLGTVVYSQEHVNQAFMVILILVIIGEFFSAPAISLADSAVLTYLDNDLQSYGKQRMFGSLGWGLAMLFIGIALDNSTRFFNHPCQRTSHHEKNYAINFTVFVVFMLFAMITSTQFTFAYDTASESMYLKVIKDKVKSKVFGGSTTNRGKLVNESDSTEDLQQQQSNEDILERQLQIKLDRNDHSKTQTVESYPEERIETNKSQFLRWVGVLRMFASPRPAAFLFVAWFMGLGVGLVFAFLFWHLQDMGGTPTLFGIASVINHLSEILAYYFSGKLINLIGHLKVLYLGLLGNVVRFLYVSWLQKPWWILPFEFLQGLTHAAVWAACCSYLTQRIPQDARSSAQSVLQGIHHGLGKGCGGLLGGLLASSYGSAILFRTYGVGCLIVLIAFLLMNYLMAENKLPGAPGLPGSDPTGPGKDGDEDHEPKEYLEESTYLSPHGIPFAPTNRNLSSSRLAEEAAEARSGKIPPGGGVRATPAPELFVSNRNPTSYQTNY